MSRYIHDNTMIFQTQSDEYLIFDKGGDSNSFDSSHNRLSEWAFGGIFKSKGDFLSEIASTVIKGYYDNYRFKAHEKKVFNGLWEREALSIDLLLKKPIPLPFSYSDAKTNKELRDMWGVTLELHSQRAQTAKGSRWLKRIEPSFLLGDNSTIIYSTHSGVDSEKKKSLISLLNFFKKYKHITSKDASVSSKYIDDALRLGDSLNKRTAFLLYPLLNHIFPSPLYDFISDKEQFIFDKKSKDIHLSMIFSNTIICRQFLKDIEEKAAEPRFSVFLDHNLPRLQKIFKETALSAVFQERRDELIESLSLQKSNYLLLLDDSVQKNNLTVQRIRISEIQTKINTMSEIESAFSSGIISRVFYNTYVPSQTKEERLDTIDVGETSRACISSRKVFTEEEVLALIGEEWNYFTKAAWARSTFNTLPDNYKNFKEYIEIYSMLGKGYKDLVSSLKEEKKLSCLCHRDLFEQSSSLHLSYTSQKNKNKPTIADFCRDIYKNYPELLEISGTDIGLLRDTIPYLIPENVEAPPKFTINEVHSLGIVELIKERLEKGHVHTKADNNPLSLAP